jgi:hypothetical protein
MRMAFSSAALSEESAPGAAASIASRAPRAVTIAIRPSGGREIRECLNLICPTAKGKNFCEKGWTLSRGKRATNLPVGQISHKAPAVAEQRFRFMMEPMGQAECGACHTSPKPLCGALAPPALR